MSIITSGIPDFRRRSATSLLKENNSFKEQFGEVIRVQSYSKNITPEAKLQMQQHAINVWCLL